MYSKTSEQASLQRGNDLSFHILEPTPNAEGTVQIPPGESFLGEYVLPYTDPFFEGVTPEQRHSVLAHSIKNALATRSRGAIAGLRAITTHIREEPEGITIETAYRAHSTAFSLEIKDGDKLASISRLTPETHHIQGMDLLKVARLMQSPEVVLLDQHFLPHTIADAEDMVQKGLPIVFQEIAIPLQDNQIGIYEHRPEKILPVRRLNRAWQGLEEDLGLTWQPITDETRRQAIQQGVILLQTIPVIIPQGLVALAQQDTPEPFEPPHGDSVRFEPAWKGDTQQCIITEYYPTPRFDGGTIAPLDIGKVNIPSYVRIKFYLDSPHSTDISNAFTNN